MFMYSYKDTGTEMNRCTDTANLFPSTSEPLVVTRALSLTQPWAMLMAFGEKLNETRSWPTSYRGWVAIHASKGFPGDCQRLCNDPAHFWPALHRNHVAHPENLPRGAVVAVTRIVGCQRTELVRDSISEKERNFGDYSDGRYSFLTEGVRRLREPLPMKGALSIWKMPREITEADLQ